MLAACSSSGSVKESDTSSTAEVENTATDDTGTAGFLDIADVVIAARAGDAGTATLQVPTVPVDLSSYEHDPNDGLVVEAENRNVYIYHDGGWGAVSPANADQPLVVARQSQPVATLDLDDEGQIAIEESLDAVAAAWVDEVLKATSGVDLTSEGAWVVTDPPALQDAIAEDGGDRWIPQLNGGVVLARDHPHRFGYIFPGSDHLWIIDGAIAALSVIAEGVLKVVGVVSGGDEEATWRPSPVATAEEWAAGNAVVQAAIDGPLADDGWVAATSQAAPSEPLVIRTTRATKKCGRFDFFCSLTGVSVNLDGPVVDLVEKAGIPGVLPSNPVGWMPLPPLNPLSADDWQQVTDPLEVLKDWPVTPWLGSPTPNDLVDAAQWTTQQLDTNPGTWFETDCHAKGPGPAADGSGQLTYPKGDYPGTVFADLETVALPADELAARLALAKAWMPMLQLDPEEQCGEISRVLARVMPYNWDAANQSYVTATRLGEAMTVEITYTVLMPEDGGRFLIRAHTGDKLGVTIGLVRTSSVEGRCGITEPQFAFVAARSAAHEDVPVDVFGTELDYDFDWVTKRVYDDLSADEIGACPPIGPAWMNSGGPPAPSVIQFTSSSSGPTLLVSESKHAAFLHSEVCEAEILNMQEFVISQFEQTLVFGPLGSVIPVDADIPGFDSAVDSVLSPLNDITERLRGARLDEGLDECNPGRTPYDLAGHVELVIDAVGAECANNVLVLSQQAFAIWPPASEMMAKEGAGGSVEMQSMYCLASGAPYPSPTEWRVGALFELDPSTITVPAAAVEVPDVRDLLPGDASAVLAEWGFTMIIIGEVPADDALVGRVVEQSPPAFDTATVGTEVMVWVGTPRSTTTQPTPVTTTTTASIPFPTDSSTSAHLRIWIRPANGSAVSGNRSVYDVGESVDVCWSWTLPPGSVWRIRLHDFQDVPYSASGTYSTTVGHWVHFDERVFESGDHCFDGVIEEPIGYEVFRVDVVSGTAEIPSPPVIEAVQVWVYVR